MSLPSEIPVANVYYLFCYAWGLFERARRRSLGSDRSPNLQTLLAKLLAGEARGIARRGLDRGYLVEADDLSTVRGRVVMLRSAELRGRGAARVACEFETLSSDTLSNQVIKATASKLIRVRGVADDYVGELRAVVRMLVGVSDIQLSRDVIERVAIHRNNEHYRLAMSICRLVVNSTQPDESGTGFVFDDVLADERRMAVVFETFVRNFYRHEQDEFRVMPLQINWAARRLNQFSQSIPTMRTDIYLRGSRRRIIVDTKYYRDALQRRWGASSFQSGNLYQLFSYLKNDAASAVGLVPSDGILIYPVTTESIDADIEVLGHSVRIATVDLSSPWQEIERRLLQIIRPFEGNEDH